MKGYMSSLILHMTSQWQQIKFQVLSDDSTFRFLTSNYFHFNNLHSTLHCHSGADQLLAHRPSRSCSENFCVDHGHRELDLYLLHYTEMKLLGITRNSSGWCSREIQMVAWRGVLIATAVCISFLKVPVKTFRKKYVVFFPPWKCSLEGTFKADGKNNKKTLQTKN